NIASGKPAPSDPVNTPNPAFFNTSVGKVTLDNIEWDYNNPHGCSPPSNRCNAAAAGNRIIRLRFNLFEKQAAAIGQADALSVFGFVTVEGSNFAPTAPFLLGAVQPPPIALDTWITYTGGVLRGFNAPAV